MLKITQRYLSAVFIVIAAILCLPSAAYACHSTHALCMNTSQSSTRVNVESGVRVYRGTVYPQDYNSQIQQNARRDHAAARRALQAKRAAEVRARVAEAKQAKAENAVVAAKSSKRTVRRSAYRAYGSPYYSRRRAYSSKPKGFNAAHKPVVTYKRRIR